MTRHTWLSTPVAWPGRLGGTRGCIRVLRWYLIYTKRAGEAIACENLNRQGYCAYFPRLLQPEKRNGRWSHHVVPLFPQYLFLQLDEGAQTLAPVGSTVGVTSIVRFGQRYAVVPDRVVEEIRSHADPTSGLHRQDRVARPAPGQSVKVRIGAFEGIEGVLTRQDGRERTVVLLTLLGYQAQLHVPSSYLVASRAA